MLIAAFLATDSLFLPCQTIGGGGGEVEAIVDHSAEIKPDLKTSIQSAMTDLERGLDGDQRQDAAAAAEAEAAAVPAENGSATLEAVVKQEPAAAADSTVSGTVIIGLMSYLRHNNRFKAQLLKHQTRIVR